MATADIICTYNVIVQNLNTLAATNKRYQIKGYGTSSLATGAADAIAMADAIIGICAGASYKSYLKLPLNATPPTAAHTPSLPYLTTKGTTGMTIVMGKGAHVETLTLPFVAWELVSNVGQLDRTKTEIQNFESKYRSKADGSSGWGILASGIAAPITKGKLFSVRL